jgi:UDP-N-acetyl-2-amino-2-deoxyglucuronate dehydrogenase
VPAVRPALLRVGFIGAGRVGDAHYAALRHAGGRAQLVAFCEPRAERRASREASWGVPGFASIPDMLGATKLDAAVVMVPPSGTAAVIAELAPSAKHVLLEKPLATTRADALAVQKHALAHGTSILMGHNGLFHPAFAAVETAVQEGRIGRILSASAESSGWLSLPDADFRRSRESSGGGVWFDTGSHLIYMLTALLGPIASSQGMLRRLARADMEGDDHALVHLAFGSGAIADLEASYARKRPGWQHDWPEGYHLALTLWGEAGAIRYQLCPLVHTSIFTDSSADWSELATPSPFQDSFNGQMAHFLDCVSGGASPRVSVGDALEVLDCLLSVKEELT